MIKTPTNITERSVQKEIVTYLSSDKFADIVADVIANPTQNAYRSGSFHGSMKMPAGIPDLTIYLVNGFYFWVEVKSHKGRMSEHQVRFIAYHNAQGNMFDELRAIVIYGYKTGGFDKKPLDDIISHYHNLRQPKL